MSTGIDVETLKLRSRDVDMHRRLRTSELFKLLQEASTVGAADAAGGDYPHALLR